MGIRRLRGLIRIWRLGRVGWDVNEERRDVRAGRAVLA